MFLSEVREFEEVPLFADSVLNRKLLKLQLVDCGIGDQWKDDERC